VLTQPLDVSFIGTDRFSSLMRTVSTQPTVSEAVSVEGTFVGRLLPGNYTVSVSLSDNTDLPPAIVPGSGRTLRTEFTFTLGVPGPGSGAAVMMAGLVLMRRRR
jgi:hypothetical protein